MRRTLPRAIVAALLSVLAAASQAQVQLVFPNEAERVAWVDLPSVGPAPDSAQKSKALKLSLSTGALGAESAVFVVDSSTGNLATRAVSLITREGGTWKLADKDFDRAHKVQIKLTHEGRPVAAAQIDVKHSKGENQALVTPSDDGTATLYGIGFGEIKVKVTTKSEGQVPDLPTFSFTLERARDQAVPVFEVAVAPKVDTTTDTGSETAATTQSGGTEKGASATQSDQNPPAAEAPRGGSGDGNPFGRFLLLLIGLGLGGAAIYFLPRLVQKNRAQVDGVLSKMGVQIPTDPEPDTGPAPAVPAQPAAPVPQPQIILDQAAPAPVVAAAPLVQPSAVATSPSLVSPSDGTRLDLVPGRHVVSREPGSPLSLVGEMSVSRAHAELVFENGVCTVEDSGSTNGTYVNGQRISAITPLKAGDIVQFGTSAWRVEGI